MSKFYQALERAEQEHALRKQKQTEGLVGAVTEPPARRRSELNRKSQPEEIASEKRKYVSPPPMLTPAGVENHLVSLLASNSFEAEQYRTLCHLIEQLREEAGLSVIAISSPAIGDGKTTTSINLAGALTQIPGMRVLLIDLDLRRPSIAEYLGGGADSQPGVIDLVRDSTLTLEDVTVTFPSLTNLKILYAGGAVTTPYDILKSFRMEEVLAEARQRYDYVILDTPPIIPFPDCRLVERIADGFLLVVAAHKTPRKLIEEATNVLDPNKIVGFIFNNDDQPVFGYSDYYSYYQYNTPRKNGNQGTRGGRFMKKFQAIFQSASED
jgi:capsular exopolysaccharide synthesis family protein